MNEDHPVVADHAQPAECWRIMVPSVGDEDALRRVLDNCGHRLGTTSTGERYIWCFDFEICADHLAVWERAKILRDKLMRLSELDPNADLRVELGSLCELQVTGEWKRHMVLEAAVGFVSLPPLTVRGYGGSGESIEEAEQSAREAEERAHAERRNRAIASAACALADDNVLEVMELLAVESPTGTDLGKVVERISNACGRDLSRFASKTQLKLLRHSINNEQVLGRLARHAVSNRAPPVKPMTIKEAKDFVHRIARQWLESLTSSADRGGASRKCV
jgi:hypothetical protein